MNKQAQWSAVLDKRQKVHRRKNACQLPANMTERIHDIYDWKAGYNLRHVLCVSMAVCIQNTQQLPISDHHAKMQTTPDPF